MTISWCAIQVDGNGTHHALAGYLSLRELQVTEKVLAEMHERNNDLTSPTHRLHSKCFCVQWKFYMLGFSHGSLSNLKVIWQGSKWRSTSLVRGSRRSICRSYQSSSAQKPDGGTKRRLCFLDSKNLPSRFPKSWKVSGKNRVGWDGGKHPMLRRSFNDLRYDALRCCALFF